MAPAPKAGGAQAPAGAPARMAGKGAEGERKASWLGGAEAAAAADKAGKADKAAAADKADKRKSWVKPKEVEAEPKAEARVVNKLSDDKRKSWIRPKEELVAEQKHDESPRAAAPGASKEEQRRANLEALKQQDDKRRVELEALKVQQEAGKAGEDKAGKRVSMARGAAAPPAAEGGAAAAAAPAPARDRPISARLSMAVSNPLCDCCQKTVFPTEKVMIEGKAIHKSCFRCSCGCEGQLSLGALAIVGGKLYSKPHYQKIFAESGGKYAAFGADDKFQHQASSSFAAGMLTGGAKSRLSLVPPPQKTT
jgi:hypothetical protein